MAHSYPTTIATPKPACTACGDTNANANIEDQPCLPASSAVQPERWFDLLRALQGTTTAERELTTTCLRAALASVASDEQWNKSGIPELLHRALDLCLSGCVTAAKKAAVGLLDFHLLVEKYRTVTKSANSSGSSSGGNTSEKHDSGPSAEGPSLKRRTSADTADSSEAGCVSKVPRPCVGDGWHFAHPSASRPSPRQAMPASAAAHSDRSLQCDAQPAPQQRKGSWKPLDATTRWTGAVTQVLDGRSVNYCSVSLEVPFKHAANFPSHALSISHLAPRKGVKLGEHYVCKCTVQTSSRNQQAKLRALAQHQLVLAAPFEENGLLLVPYLDSSDALKMVAFFILT